MTSAPSGKPWLWKPGQSGNPGGASKMQKETRDRVQSILKGGAPDAAKRILELVHSADEKVALAASRDILDRLFGKPRYQVDVQTTSVAEVFAKIAQGVVDEKEIIGEVQDAEVIEPEEGT